MRRISLRPWRTLSKKQVATIGRILKYVRWGLLPGRHVSASSVTSTKSLEDLDTNDPALD